MYTDLFIYLNKHYNNKTRRQSTTTLFTYGNKSKRTIIKQPNSCILHKIFTISAYV